MNAIYTDASFQNISNIANRYGISTNSVANLAHAIIASNGSMAQFNIPELGGGGQWMQGGMTMVGDMFNNGLKATVDGLCVELSNLLNQGGLQYKPLPNNQNQGGGFQSANWWGDLGSPNSSGSQNGMSYAIFNNSNRLAIQLNGAVTVFNTLDHQIGGVGQQQGGNYSVSFSSQYGNVNLDTLPIVSGNGNQPEPIQQPEPINQPQNNSWEQPQHTLEACEPIQNNTSNISVEEDIFAKIEKLAGLKDKNIISVDEFENRKTALLDRL